MLESYLFEKHLDHIGAGTGTQTRGLFLGKEALYQLSYTRLRALHYGGQARSVTQRLTISESKLPSIIQDESEWLAVQSSKGEEWWRLLDSNQRHEALQATALPTELRRRDCQKVRR